EILHLLSIGAGRRGSAVAAAFAAMARVAGCGRQDLDLGVVSPRPYIATVVPEIYGRPKGSAASSVGAANAGPGFGTGIPAIAVVITVVDREVARITVCRSRTGRTSAGSLRVVQG